MPTYLSPGVYVEEVQSGSRPIEGVGTAVAAFVGFAEKGPTNQATLVSNWTSFTDTFGGFVPGTYLARSVYGYLNNGGGNCYVVRIGPNGGADTRDKPVAELPAAPQATLGRLRITALESAPNPTELSVEVTDAGGDADEPDMFRLLVKRHGEVVEDYDQVTVGRGKTNVVAAVKAESSLISAEEMRGALVQRPDNRETALTTPPAPAAAPPERLSSEDYIGDVADRTGFSGLETIEEVTMLAVPDLMSAYQQRSIDLDAVQAVQLGMIGHCELMGDRIAILDPPPGLNAQQVKEWRVDKAGYDSAFAALYYPWVKTADPSTGRMTFMPPSGHVAGIWGRNDDTRGVHKAPANEVVRGALTVELTLTTKEQELLNPLGINCIRAFPGRGIRVWGARTLASDPAWRYLNIRRLFNYLEESILAGTQWVVFEPNDRALWARIRRTVGTFLVNEWRRGSLFGSTPDEAFYVKCDDETNPAESIDAGQVVCEVGVAPVKPAEFVVFRLAQFSGGTSLVSE